MQVAALERELRNARDSSACVPPIGRFFAAAALHYGHGTDAPEDEAHWLVAACLDWDEARWAAPPAPAVLERIVALAEARVSKRVPLAYLLGEAWFAGLRFEVDESVLVPRSPLAELIESGFEPWCRLEPGDRLLEIGTGSGCIACAIARHVEDVRVDATDVSPQALELARRNAHALGVGERIRWFERDLFPDGETGYRVIISNPPYVPAGRLAELPPEYGHEPAVGLDGGDDGLDIVRRIVAGARTRLAADGVLIVEVGESAQAMVEAYPRLPATWLEFERGGDGVFLVTCSELAALG